MTKEYDIGEIVHNISFHPEERSDIFLALPHKIRAAVLLRLTKHVLYGLLEDISNKEIAVTLEHLDTDEATDVIQSLPKSRQSKITKHLQEEFKSGIELLSQFDPESAAGLMNLGYILVEEDDKVASVAKQFKAHEKRTGRLPAIIATRQREIVGYLPGHELGFTRPTERIKKYIRRIYTIKHNAGHDEVVHVFREHPHNKIAVLGEENNVLGIIYSDDVLRVMEKHKGDSLYDFAGVHDEESVTDTARTKIKFRYKWLIINLGTAFLAAFTVGLFDETISKYVLLAIYMPIVAGMGGNAATQTLAVLVRGIALKQISLSTALPVLRREVGAAFANGVINGVIVATIVYAFHKDIKIALILGSAMIINLLVAGFFGTLIPLVMKRLGKDPATSATIFITTATDVLGFLVFLGLAAIVLN